LEDHINVQVVIRLEKVLKPNLKEEFDVIVSSFHSLSEGVDENV
jgi:hypothetical protein